MLGYNIVSVIFYLLPRDTNFGSMSDVHVNFRPKKALRNEFFTGLNTWVRQTRQKVKRSSAKVNWT